MKYSYRHCFILIGIVATLLLSGCGHNKWRNAEGMVWNTVYHITYESDHNLQDSITSVLAEVGKSLSVFDPYSLISKINANIPIKADRHLKSVFLKSKEINRQTSGAFDPTVSPLITAWGFGKGHKATSDTLRIDSILNFVGMDKTALRNDFIVKTDKRLSFNFSAIAKGYGCDAIAEMMKRNGVKNFLIEIGGEINAEGHSPSMEKWRISIDNPVVSEKEIHSSNNIVAISNEGLATSGNYRNFHIRDGKFIGHTISPKTGHPILTDVLSATVIAPTTMEADAFATAFMVMGSTAAINMSDSIGLPVYLILSDSTSVSSKKMSLYLNRN